MGTTKFYLDSTVNFSVTFSATFQKEFRSTAGSGTNVLSTSIAGGTSPYYLYTTESEGPAHNSATWPTTNWSWSIDINTGNAALELIPGYARTNTSTVNVNVDFHTAVAGTGIFTGTDTYDNANLGSPNSSDYVSSLFQANNTNMMTAFTLSLDEADTWIQCTSLVNSLGTPQIVCPVIATSSTVNNFEIRPVQKINFNVLNVPGSILSPSVVPPPSTVQLQVIAATSTIPNPTVVQKIVVPVINTPSSLFNPSTKYDVILPVVVTSSSINNPSVLHRFLISMQVITANSTIFSPTVNQDIALNVYNATSVIFSPSLDYNVVFPVLNAPETVLQPATDTSANIELLFVADDSTIFSPSLNQDVSLDTLNAPATVPNPEVASAGAEQDISLVVIDATSTVLNPSVTTLTTVEAQVLESPSTVLSPSLKYDVVLPVVTTVSTIFSPSLEQIVQMQLVNTAPTVYAPRIGEEVDDGFSGAIIDRPGFPPFPIGIR